MKRLTMIAGLASVAAVVLAACSPAPTGAPSNVVTSSPAPSAAAASPVGTTSASFPSQTDTAWGRIWDALPQWFPTPDGASPTETGTGPATAELELPTDLTAAAAADFFRTELLLDFPSVDRDGPLEDGSFVVSVAGSCQVEVRLVPLGGRVVARILYGAGCPFVMK